MTAAPESDPVTDDIPMIEQHTIAVLVANEPGVLAPGVFFPIDPDLTEFMHMAGLTLCVKY